MPVHVNQLPIKKSYYEKLKDNLHQGNYTIYLIIKMITTYLNVSNCTDEEYKLHAFFFMLHFLSFIKQSGLLEFKCHNTNCKNNIFLHPTIYPVTTVLSLMF